MKDVDKSEIYQTSDLSLAAVLSIKYPVKTIINKNGRGIFVFTNSAEMERFVNMYWNKQLTVEPQAMFDAIKTLKNRLFNDIKEENDR